MLRALDWENTYNFTIFAIIHEYRPYLTRSAQRPNQNCEIDDRLRQMDFPALACLNVHPIQRVAVAGNFNWNIDRS
jgi:hypothetical protein